MIRLRDDRQVYVGLAAVLVAGLILVAGLSGLIAGLFSGSETRTVTADMTDSQQLRKGADVRIDGVDAGQVEKVELTRDGRSARVTMAVRDDAGPLYKNAGAILRWKTVLGGTFYVDLERGSASRGELGDATIPPERTARQVELEDVAGAIRGDSKRGLQTLAPELADALRDERAPKRLFDTVARVAPGVERGVGALRGQELDRDLRALVTETSRTVHALDSPFGELRGLIQGAATTLATTAARGDDIRATVRQVPATADEVNRTLVRLDGTLDLADPLVSKLDKPAGKVAPTFASLRPTVVDADALLQRARPLLAALRPASTSLARTAKLGLPLVNELAPSLARLDKTILPSLSEVDKGTKHTTAVMIGGTFTGLASGAGGQMDNNGHFIRFPATMGSSPLNSLPCQSYFGNPDAPKAVACQSLQEALTTFLNYRPLGDTPGTEP